MEDRCAVSDVVEVAPIECDARGYIVRIRLVHYDVGDETAAAGGRRPGAEDGELQKDQRHDRNETDARERMARSRLHVDVIRPDLG